MAFNFVFKGLRQHKFAITAVWTVGFVFLAANLAVAAGLGNRIFPGVKLGSANLGGLTRHQAEAIVREQVSHYALNIKVDSKSYQVSPRQLGATYEVGIVVDKAMQVGHQQWLPLLGLWQAHQHPPLVYAYSIDHAVLTDYLSKLSVQQAQAPVDATVVVTNGVPKVQPDKSGLGVNIEILASQIEQSINDQAEAVVVHRTPLPAAIRATDADVAAQAAQKLIASRLELTYNDKTFVPTAAQIGSWLDFNPASGKLVAQVNPDRLHAYIEDSVSPQIYLKPVNHVVNMINGEIKSDDAGVNGLQVDGTNLAAQISAALGQASSKITIPTAVIAFKTVYNKTIQLDVGRYIEVNLTTQHLWAYQDKQVVFDSPVTSGATGAGYPTVQGLFSIYSKERNRYLDGRPLGYNYNVFVQYWMPFYADYGLHDASWRSAYGGPDYYYNGSHGCVNLPLATAAWIWDWSSIGTPVWVHS